MTLKEHKEVAVIWLRGTAKAFQAYIPDGEGFELGREWFPYSQVTLKGGKEANADNVAEGEAITIEIPQWLFDKKDLQTILDGGTAQSVGQEIESTREKTGLFEDGGYPEEEKLEPKPNWYDYDIPF